MRIVFLNLAFDELSGAAEQLLDRFRGLSGWAEAMVAAVEDEGTGIARVTVVQRFQHVDIVERGPISYHFVVDPWPAELDWWQRSRPAEDRAVELCSNARRRGQDCVVHLNGLGHAGTVRGLRRRLHATVPIIVQHHAERPRSGMAGLHQRWGLKDADGFFFTARGLADEWIRRSLLGPTVPVFEVMEASTSFARSDRAVARERTGITGSPVFLWVGRLDSNKDPLTVLAGLEPVLSELPEARLYMAFGPDSPLLPQVAARLAGSEVLQPAVRLLGEVPHGDMEAVHNSADYFLLGSHLEGSGYALVEALACGTVPIVTDIPSFRWMTDGGAVGRLWTPGDTVGLTSAVRTLLGDDIDRLSAAARRCFESRLSYAAIGRDALTAYRIALRSRASRA